MREGILFSELEIRDKKLKDCELKFDQDGYRLYVLIDKKSNMFDALAIEFASSSATLDDHWSCSELRVNNIFSLVAYFDGVRHFRVNSTGDPDMDGYLYYPNIQSIIDMMQIVRGIELDTCWDCDK